MESFSGVQDLALVEGEAPGLRVCVIDLGSNSFHALIADVRPDGTYHEVDRLKEMVQLGRQGFREGYLVEEAMERGIRALERIKLLAEGRGVHEYVIYATSAIREATNGGVFLDRVQREVGLRVTPISGEQEALLIWKGVRRFVELPRPALLVDIGGGSTEISVADREKAYFLGSFKLGAARLTETFMASDPLEAEDEARLREHLRAELAPVLEVARAYGVETLVGSSGTLENLGIMVLKAQGRRNGHLYRQPFEAASWKPLLERLMHASREERLAMPGLEARRVDQIVAGALLVDELLRSLPIREIRLSRGALREGMVYHFMETRTKWIRRLAPFTSVRRRSVYELAYRFRWEAEHARQVTRLALVLFDELKPLHGLGEVDRELLEYAALLHDIGYVISRKNHHKHGAYLVQHADLPGFTSEEIRMLASMVRYHSGRLPDPGRNKHLARLSPEGLERMKKLTAILRLANGLDRSHFGNVLTLWTEVDEEEVRIYIRTRTDPQLELWGAYRDRELFEQVYGRRVRILPV